MHANTAPIAGNIAEATVPIDAPIFATDNTYPVLPTGPPIMAANYTNLSLFVFIALATPDKFPWTPLYIHDQIAKKVSCRNVLAKGAIASTIPRMVVSTVQAIPAIIPANIFLSPTN